MRSSFILFLFVSGFFLGPPWTLDGTIYLTCGSCRAGEKKKAKRKFRRGGKMCRSERVNVVPFFFLCLLKSGWAKKRKGKKCEMEKNLKVQ